MSEMIKLIIFIFIIAFNNIYAASSINTRNDSMNHKIDKPKLPDYVIFDLDKENQDNKSIRIQAKELIFPLSESDLEDISTLEKKFDQEEGCAGLAAPQIGISKRIIIFALPDDPEIKKWRPDFTQSMPKTIWLNPSFEASGDDMSEDYEACFSVPNIAAKVKRYNKINYKAYDIEGNLIQGQAEGFLARIIQHEIDHLNGILFIDHVSKDSLMSMEEYRQMRKEAMESK